MCELSVVFSRDMCRAVHCHLRYKRGEYLENYFIQYSFCPIINLSCDGSGGQSSALAVSWVRRSVASIDRAIAQAVNRRLWPSHGSSNQSLALSVPGLRRLVACY